MNRILLILALFISTSLPCEASVIFQTNFDSAAETDHTGGTVPTGWTSWYEQGPTSATRDSVTHYGGEISSPGRGGTGKSLKLWRHTDYVGQDYVGGLGYTFGGSYGSLFMRYYMKLPTALDNIFQGSNGNYLKTWRFNTTGGEIYLNVAVPDLVNMRVGGALIITDAGGFYEVIIPAGSLPTTIWDGNWHCVQFQIGLNSSTLKLWIDGVEYYSNTSFNWSGSAGATFVYLQHFGFGNSSSNYLWQNSWQAAEWDDFIMATTKAETDPDGGESAPTRKLNNVTGVRVTLH